MAASDSATGVGLSYICCKRSAHQAIKVYLSTKQGIGSLPSVRYQTELTPGSCKTSVEAMNCFATEKTRLQAQVSP